MAYDVTALRGFGDARVAMDTTEGSCTGRIVQEKLGDEPVMLLFARDDRPEPLEFVVPVESIVRISTL